MRAVTIKEAKAHLNELIEAAHNGEQVVLMRGSTHVATIVPITEADIELSPLLTDAQAERFWESVKTEKRVTFDSVEEGVAFLKRETQKSPRKKR